MQKITNEAEIQITSEDVHRIKIMTNSLVRLCREVNIPIFIAFHIPQKGYQYNALFPEEIEYKPEYGKFKKFLQTIIDFNKEEYVQWLLKE